MARSASSALERANALRHNMDYASGTRSRVRAIMDGGPGAVLALLGDQMQNIGEEDLPWANFMLSGLTTLAQQLGSVPQVRIPPPHDTDNEAPRKRAEKRERIVEAYDTYDRLALQLPQVGRWLPGYGYAVWTINSYTSQDGYMYPCAQLRDPYDCYPGEWGVTQQPEELAVARRIPPMEAMRLYPKYAGQIQGLTARGASQTPRGSSSGWDNQYGRGLEIVEYYDRDGCHYLIPAIEERVDFHVNPISSPAFVIAKRFAFNHLVGQYDQMIGLMAGIAKLNVLYFTAMEDNVFAPTNVSGDMDGQYRKGRFAVNRMTPGTRVEIPQSNIPYQAFEMIARMERMARVVAGYPVQADSLSPANMAATGAGLEELSGSVDRQVEEYHTVLAYALQDLDAKRLEWDEMVNGQSRKPLATLKQGVPHTESYTPSKDIKGDYRTTRKYGILDGVDQPSKIVAMGQLMTMGIIDRRTVRENVSGLDNLTLIEERITDDRMRELVYQSLMGLAQSGDPRPLQVAIKALPAGDEKTLLLELFPEPEQPDPMMADPMAGMGAPAGPPPDITTVLSQLQGSGASKGGIQTVSRV